MPVRCDCGGTLRPAKVKDFDLTKYLGLPVMAKELQGLRCDKCDWETIDGKTMQQAAHAAAGLVLEQPARLPKEMLKFLRSYLRLTQQELAKRMGISRKTVNEWETRGKISPQHDLLLRTLVYTHLVEAFRPKLAVLDHVRTAAAPRIKPLVLGKIAA